MYAMPTDFNFSAGDKFVISFPSISIWPENMLVNPYIE
jgi:hypothetical protein